MLSSYGSSKPHMFHDMSFEYDCYTLQIQPIHLTWDSAVYSLFVPAPQCCLCTETLPDYSFEKSHSYMV